MKTHQAYGLERNRKREARRCSLSLWSEVTGLSPEQSRDVRALLEADLGNEFLLIQGLSPEAMGGVALVPVWEASDPCLFALVHRIRERIEQARGPRRLLFVAVGPAVGAVHKIQTLSWIRQALVKSLDSEPFFVGWHSSRPGALDLGGKKVRFAVPLGEKNIRLLEGLSKVLLDWGAGEKRAIEGDGSETVKSLRDEVFEVLSERWGLVEAPSSQTFPRDHQFQEECRFGASALERKSEKCEAGSFDSARIDVSAGTRIGGNRE